LAARPCRGRERGGLAGLSYRTKSVSDLETKAISFLLSYAFSLVQGFAVFLYEFDLALGDGANWVNCSPADLDLAHLNERISH
jgi:hypothetical protein